MLMTMMTAVVGMVATFWCALFLMRFLSDWRLIYATQWGHFLSATTRWFVSVFHRFLPSSYRFDWVSLLGAYCIVWIQVFIFLSLLGAEWTPSLLGTLFFLALMKLCLNIIELLSFLVVVQAILSWINPMSGMMQVMAHMLSFLLNPVRRVLPSIGGIDLSPLLLLIVLQVIRIPVLSLLPLWLH